MKCRLWLFLILASIILLFAPVSAVTCDSGTLDTTCNITTSQNVTGEDISGSGNLVIRNGGDLWTDSGPDTTVAINMAGYVAIESGGSITGNANITTANLTIETGGEINVDYKGYAGGPKLSAGFGSGAGGTGTGGGGAGHGGNGGNGYGSAGGTSYDSLTEPQDLGSGGGGGGTASAGSGGAGGGLLKLYVSETLAVNGSIQANGGGGSVSDGRGGGGGSGGSIWIDAKMITGTGTIRANGGNGGDSSYDGGGGAGGRIA
ncbi:hypothetical protein GQ473_03985, partial [archaeon]|nr:hypothetical protein [archaeon]